MSDKQNTDGQLMLAIHQFEIMTRPCKIHCWNVAVKIIYNVHR